MEFHDIVIQQKSYFDSNSTKSIAFRKIMLKKLMDALDEREDLLLEALHKDLGKSRGEGYMTEVGMVRSEIKEALINVEACDGRQMLAGSLHDDPACCWTAGEKNHVVPFLPKGLKGQVCLRTIDIFRWEKVRKKIFDGTARMDTFRGTLHNGTVSCRNRSHKGHQRKIQGIVPRRDDEHHAIRVPALSMPRRTSILRHGASSGENS